MSGPLSGFTILVTRSAGQGRHLCALIEGAGGRALHVPALIIAALEDPAPARARLATAGECAAVLFVSANAVAHGLALLRAAGGRLPAGRVFAVGAATAAALRAAGVPDPGTAAGVPSSEGLLALPALAAAAIAGRRVLIVRGGAGRELLARALRERGARVETVQVYRRVAPPIDDRLRARLHGAAADLAVAASGETLENLAALLRGAGRADLLARPLLVVAPRLVEVARASGFRGPVLIAASARDADVFAALNRWAGARRCGAPDPLEER